MRACPMMDVLVAARVRKPGNLLPNCWLNDCNRVNRAQLRACNSNKAREQQRARTGLVKLANSCQKFAIPTQIGCTSECLSRSPA